MLMSLPFRVLGLYVSSIPVLAIGTYKRFYFMSFVPVWEKLHSRALGYIILYTKKIIKLNKIKFPRNTAAV